MTQRYRFHGTTMTPIRAPARDATRPSPRPAGGSHGHVYIHDDRARPRDQGEEPGKRSEAEEQNCPVKLGEHRRDADEARFEAMGRERLANLQRDGRPDNDIAGNAEMQRRLDAFYKTQRY